MALRVVVVIALVPSLGWGQVPVGSRFQVNTYTTGSQGRSAVSMDGSGRFVVVWQDFGQEGSQRGVFRRRYDAGGAPLDPVELQVNSFTTGDQMSPRVAWAANGDFVVVWESMGQDGSLYGVFGQKYDESGAALSQEDIPINSYTTSHQRFPAVASRPDGSFVSVWESFRQVGSQLDLFGRSFDPAGAPAGPEFQVSSNTTYFHDDPDIDFAANGEFVVAYSRPNPDTTSTDVFFQRFDAVGAKLGSEMRVNSYTTETQLRPSLAVLPDGGFVIVWDSWLQDGGGNLGVFGQRFDAAGDMVGNEFRVNAYTTGPQSTARVAADGAGNFVVVWQSWGQGSTYYIFGQRYDVSGAPDGAEFRVDASTSTQRYPFVAAGETGRFVVTWNGASYEVFGQLFAPDVIFGDGFESGGPGVR